MTSSQHAHLTYFLSMSTLSTITPSQHTLLIIIKMLMELSTGDNSHTYPLHEYKLSIIIPTEHTHNLSINTLNIHTPTDHTLLIIIKMLMELSTGDTLSTRTLSSQLTHPYSLNMRLPSQHTHALNKHAYPLTTHLINPSHLFTQATRTISLRPPILSTHTFSINTLSQLTPYLNKHTILINTLS